MTESGAAAGQNAAGVIHEPLARQIPSVQPRAAARGADRALSTTAVAQAGSRRRHRVGYRIVRDSLSVNARARRLGLAVVARGRARHAPAALGPARGGGTAGPVRPAGA